MDQNDAIIYKEYPRAFDHNLDLVLLKGSIVRVPQADVIVNCTGKYFQHESNYIIVFKQIWRRIHQNWALPKTRKRKATKV